MNSTTIYHNPRCSKSRAAVAAASDDAVVIDYLKEPLTTAQLLDLLSKLEDDPSDLVRRDGAFTELGLRDEDVQTAEQVADVLAAHPRLMQRPVLVRDGRAIIGRPTERAEAFLAG